MLKVNCALCKTWIQQPHAIQLATGYNVLLTVRSYKGKWVQDLTIGRLLATNTQTARPFIRLWSWMDDDDGAAGRETYKYKSHPPLHISSSVGYLITLELHTNCTVSYFGNKKHLTNSIIQLNYSE